MCIDVHRHVYAHVHRHVCRQVGADVHADERAGHTYRGLCHGIFAEGGFNKTRKKIVLVAVACRD